MGPKILLLLCFAAALGPGYCEPKTFDEDGRSRLPEFLTELDLASLEASEEDIEALKTVVKRLAPEKNGEYQVYQVFFGNEELLNEWLKGAGVMGQPGVDFPVLTTIPATNFSCRGLSGGYYADLETNCQVFHICDNGRKISFLCPNGTIFQQSQLICDWWFKVDCSKSTGLYEQSAEQLAEEERKRSDAKRMKSEFHRSSVENDDYSGQQNYYQSQNDNYDGRQNGRTNPYGQTSNKNQIPGSASQRGQTTDSKSSTRTFDPNQIYQSNGVLGNQYNQINDLAASNVFKVSLDGNGSTALNSNSNNARPQEQIQTLTRSSSDRGNYRPVERQQNQLVEGANREEKRQFNYDQRGASKYTGSNQNSYQNPQQQPARSNQQSLDYSSSNRNGGKDSDRRNFGKSSSIGSSIGSSDYELSSNRVTPSYTETTTFRTSTPSPIREYQQLAESAAFVSHRGNRFNEAYRSSQFNNYYSFNNSANGNGGNNNRSNNNSGNNNSKTRIHQKTTDKPQQKSITPTAVSDKITNSFSRVRGGSSSSSFSTFQPIYKPKTSNSYPSTKHETTTLGSTIASTVTTTTSPDTHTDYYTRNNYDRTAYTDRHDYTTTGAYQTNQDFQSTTEPVNTDVTTEDYLRDSVTPSSDQTAITNTEFFENTTPTIIISGSYVNAKTYTSNKALGTSGSYRSTSDLELTTSKPHTKSQEYRQNSVATAEPVNESTVRRSESSSHYVTTQANYRDVTVNQNDDRIVNARNEDNRSSKYQQERGPIKDLSRANTPSAYRSSQNSISTSTEKPRRSSSTAFQQSGATGKTLSPYDTSITYQQGKVMSTLGPYLPFTKNYAYSTTTTSTTIKPPVYTATVPTYSSTASVYRSSSAKSLGGKVRVSSLVPPRPTGRTRTSSAAYLPEKKSGVSTYSAKKHSLSERPPTEREHAMSMLQSLRGLEGTAPSLLGVINSTRSGLNIPTSSGPSTLHSLALYFATASDGYDATAESRTDSTAESVSAEAMTAKVIRDNASIELPRTILTQHTINSYAELFNLNNALEGNSSAERIFEEGESNEDSDDLDIQQSEGPIDGVRKSNSTKLRELAQVFTHALSAYLQDPDTFKKILTEIRPTEPSVTATDEERFTATTSAPTTPDDYPSVTKEKDEVLDFSDDTTPPRGRRPTTIYPATTTTDPPVTTDAFTQHEYYTTTSGDYYTTTPTVEATSADSSNNPTGPSDDFAFQVNHAFGNTGNAGNDLSSGNGGRQIYTEEVSGPSGPSALGDTEDNDGINDYADNYFPTDENSGNNRIGGFQNNTPPGITYEPYGKHVKPYDATPISDNYVASSTPATYGQEHQPQTVKNGGNADRRNNGVTENLNPPTYFPQQHQRMSGHFQNTVASYNGKKHSSSRVGKESHDRKTATTEPFRIRYYDSTTVKPETNNRETLLTAGSVYSTYRDGPNDFADNDDGTTDRSIVVTSVVTSRTTEPVTGTAYTESESFNTVTNNKDVTTTNFDENNNVRNDKTSNDHWTSSPAVTQLWESTVFVDPKRINQGLVSGTRENAGPSSSSESGNNNNRQQQESLVTDATSSGVSSRSTSSNVDYPSSPWQWAGSSSRSINNENDSPTAFTLLPQPSYTSLDTNIGTATPSSIYTTRSSITTTITSSVTSTSSDTSGEVPLRQDDSPLFSGLIQQQSAHRPKHGAAEPREPINVADNEITKAHNMFGNLNSTSTNTLMRVMKQADTNATVRQLVLLLINHCNGPMNKTMEEEKQQLLEALLRMPVNEFTSEESRDLVAGINGLHLPIGTSASSTEKRSTTTISSTTTTTSSTTTPTTTTTEEPVVTTFRSKKGRRFKSNAEEASPSRSGRNGETVGTAETSDDLSLETAAASDVRALELLRSLYTIAAKWG